jgi:hypothetical protein
MNDDNQYVVECLRERRNRGRMIEYLVKCHEIDEVIENRLDY